MQIYKIEAEGDTVYVQGETIGAAERKFENAFGFIPKKLVTWTKVDELPADEEFVGEVPEIE